MKSQYNKTSPPAEKPNSRCNCAKTECTRETQSTSSWTTTYNSNSRCNKSAGWSTTTTTTKMSKSTKTDSSTCNRSRVNCTSGSSRTRLCATSTRNSASSSSPLRASSSTLSTSAGLISCVFRISSHCISVIHTWRMPYRLLPIGWDLSPSWFYPS